MTGLAAMPVRRGEEWVGALAVSWQTPVQVDAPVRHHLEALAELVSRRLTRLPFPAPSTLPLVLPD
jgi:hypothetical protein